MPNVLGEPLAACPCEGISKAKPVSTFDGPTFSSRYRKDERWLSFNCVGGEYGFRNRSGGHLQKAEINNSIHIGSCTLIRKPGCLLPAPTVVRMDVSFASGAVRARDNTHG